MTIKSPWNHHQITMKSPLNPGKPLEPDLQEACLALDQLWGELLQGPQRPVPGVQEPGLNQVVPPSHRNWVIKRWLWVPDFGHHQNKKKVGDEISRVGWGFSVGHQSKPSYKWTIIPLTIDTSPTKTIVIGVINHLGYLGGSTGLKPLKIGLQALWAAKLICSSMGLI